MRTCKKCGGAVGIEDLYCIHCGTPLEKETKQEESKTAEKSKQAAILSVWDYLFMGIILVIPVVNFIVAILWIVSKNGNPNRRNLAKAWLILAVAGTILSGILAFGLFQFFVMDHPVIYDHHIEYSIPEEMFRGNFPFQLNEI